MELDVGVSVSKALPSLVEVYSWSLNFENVLKERAVFAPAQTLTRYSSINHYSASHRFPDSPNDERYLTGSWVRDACFVPILLRASSPIST